MEVKKKSAHGLLQNIYLKTVLKGAAVFALLIVVLIIWLRFYTHHNESIVVPDLRGYTVEEAADVLKNKHLRFEVIDSVYIRGKKPGSVIEQIPAAESNVKEGRIVFLSINSMVAKKIPVPDVRDQSTRQATATLTAMGFNVSQVVEVPSQYKDLVVDVIFKGAKVFPGQRLPMGANLILNVGDGSEPIDADSTSQEPVEKVENSEESWF